MEGGGDRRAQRTKKAIRGALITLMSEKDVGKINVTELMEAADLSRKTFYLHYESVADVLEEIEGDIVGGLREILDECGLAEHRASSFVLFQCIHSIVTADEGMYKNFVTAQGYSFLTVKVKNAMKQAILGVAGIADGAQAMRRSAAAEFTVSGIIAMYIDWYENGCLFPLEELALLADGMLSRGVGAL